MDQNVKLHFYVILDNALLFKNLILKLSLKRRKANLLKVLDTTDDIGDFICYRQDNDGEYV